MHHIVKYFPRLTEEQKDKFEKLGQLYKFWNTKINVISRKDIDSVYLHHILHSLAIGKIIQFKSGSKIIDVGTGGGLPGIPLSILFPEVTFYLVDSTGKKIKVVNTIIDSLRLKNCIAEQIRAEDTSGQYDFIVSRAVGTLPRFINIVHDKVSKKSINSLANGLFYLKGGDIKQETDSLSYNSQVFMISDFFNESYFETKKIVYVNLTGTA